MTYDVEFALYYALLIGFHSVTLTETKDAAIDENKLNVTAGELLLELMIKIAANPNQWSKVHNFLGNLSDSVLLQKLGEAENIDLGTFVTKRTTAVTPISNKEKPVKQFFSKPSLADKTYSKTFSYRRVTGQPILFDKSPKAYVAVSIIAPKPGSNNLNEDSTLEKELQLLKPWSHKENLENMAALRSRWLIRN